MQSSMFKATIMVLAAVLVCAGQQQPVADQATGTAPPAKAEVASNGPGQPTFSQRYPRYVLRPGDVLDLRFEFSPEFNESATVQPDGFVNLREIGDLQVSGQTVPEVTKTIQTAYARILNAPVISIVLKDFEKPYFIASGQVGRPGKYELRGETTLTEAIAEAGGFNESAKHSAVVLYRRVEHGWTAGQVVDVKKMWQQRGLTEDVYLHPGDMVFVPQNSFSKIRHFIPSTGFSPAIP